MSVFRCFSLVVRWFNYTLVKRRFHSPIAMKHTIFTLVISLVLSTMLLTACMDSSGGPGASPTAIPSDLPLAKLHWCEKPSMLFRDEGAIPTPTVTATATATASSTPATRPTASPTTTPTAATQGTPTTVNDWGQVKANLGFTVYLPATLPRNTCLVSAQATIHDPTFGGNFLIGYLLPDHTSLAISEAPLSLKTTAFQCNVANSSTSQANSSTAQKSAANSAATAQASPSPTQVPLQECTGAKNSTGVVLSARRSIEYLQQVFNTLQPDVTWIPAT